jgi:hypothetical protein
MSNTTLASPYKRATIGLTSAVWLTAAVTSAALGASPSASGVIPSAASSSSLGAIDHPTGATDIVLSMETGGGFVRFGSLLIQAPTFVLYGDGTAVFRPGEDPTQTGMPPFIKATLSAAQIDALLAFAIDVGHLGTARAEYVEMSVADAPTTLFTLDAAGLRKTVSVYALGITSGTGPDAADYRAFEDLALLLSTFEEQVARGQVLSAEVYEPTLYRVALIETAPGQRDAIDWPWTDLTPADFAPLPDNPSAIVAGLSPDQVASVTPTPSGGLIGVAVRSPDGATVYDLALRPLLPGEDVLPQADRPA